MPNAHPSSHRRNLGLFCSCDWGSPCVMKLCVTLEVLRWLMKFRKLCSGGFHPNLVTPPYQGFPNVNIPPNDSVSVLWIFRTCFSIFTFRFDSGITDPKARQGCMQLFNFGNYEDTYKNCRSKILDSHFSSPKYVIDVTINNIFDSEFSIGHPWKKITTF